MTRTLHTSWQKVIELPGYRLVVSDLGPEGYEVETAKIGSRGYGTAGVSLRYFRKKRHVGRYIRRLRRRLKS